MSHTEQTIAKQRPVQPRRARKALDPRARHKPDKRADKRDFFALSPTKAFSEALGTALDQRRLLIVVPFCLIGGLIVNASLPYDPQFWALVNVGLLLAAFAVAMRHRFRVLQGVAAAGSFWAGFCLLSLHGLLWGTPMLIYPAYGIYAVDVDTVLSSDENAQRLIVSNITPQTGARNLPIRKARLFIRGDMHFERGDRVEGALRFAPVPGPVVPGGFDFQFHNYFNGVGAFGSATGTMTLIKSDGGFLRNLAGARNAIGERIDAVLSDPERAIARALVIGDQSRIDDETRRTMADAGLAHILAISGLHLTLVAGGVFTVFRAALALSPRWGAILPVKKTAALLGGMVAIAYLSLAGGSVSATRATLMLLLVFGAVLAGRRALTMRNVAFAAIFLIVLNPAAVFRPSFQLSFAAVTALIAVYETRRVHDYAPKNSWQRLWGYVWAMALTSLIAGLATLVFAAYHFQQTAPLGVLGNILALPILAFIVLPAGVASMVLMPLSLEVLPLQVMGWGTGLILQIASQVERLSTGLTQSPILSPLALICALAALSWLAFFPGKLRYAGIALVLPVIALFGVAQKPDVIIADSSQAIAIRQSASVALAAGRAPSFATDAWAQTYSLPIANDYEGLACDAAACIGKSPEGFGFAVVKRSDAFAEECGIADLVITRLNAPSWCAKQSLTIDADDLDVKGVTTLRWHDEKKAFTAEYAITNPERTWRIKY